jgi:hypothetical protein
MKKIVMILFAGLLVSAGLQAQKVCIENGKVILDLTEAAGMPAGAITNVSKTALYADATPSNTAGPLTNNTTTGTINEKVFQKLEIAPSDLGEMNWADAMAGCKNKGQGWRLPAQRELLLMWIFIEALVEALPEVDGGATLSPVLYWGATESDVSAAWSMNFDTGVTLLSLKKNECLVRCVREVN